MPAFGRFALLSDLCLVMGALLSACDPPPPDLDLRDLGYPTLGDTVYAWQDVPLPFEVTVRNNGSAPARARLAYVASGDTDRQVRMGPRVSLAPGQERQVSMAFDVRPQWTQNGLFGFRIFLAKDEPNQDTFDEALYPDSHPENHIIATSAGGLPVHTLYDRLRLRVTRLRASVPARVLLTTNWGQTHPTSGVVTPLGETVWPENGPIDLPVGEWVEVNQPIEVALGGPVLTERSLARPWLIDFNIGGQFNNVLVTSLSSASLPAGQWSQSDLRLPIPGTAFGQYSTGPIEFEIRIEGLEPYAP